MGMSVILHPTADDDLELVRTLERDPENSPYIRQWSRDRHLRSIEDDNEAHFLIVDGSTGTLKGYAILIGVQDEDDSLQLKRLVIAAKGQGSGRSALKAIKQFAFREVRCHRLWLEVLEGYDSARGLYESEGFQVEGIARESFKRGHEYASLIIMSILAGEHTTPRGQ